MKFPPTSRPGQRSPFSKIESLEPRIAPAAINPLLFVPNPGDLKISDPKTAYFHDPDGDFFIFKTTKGAFTPGNFNVDGAGIIESIDVSFDDFNSIVKGVKVGTFQGAAISAKVILPTKTNGLPTTGDGRLNIGYVNALKVDLSGFTLPGDLARIDAGDVTDKTTGLGLLSVQSMGALGVTTQANLAGSHAAKLTSNIHGRLGTLRVLAVGKNIIHQTMRDVFIDVTAPDPGGLSSQGAIGAVVIDGLTVTNNEAAVFNGATPTYTPATIRTSGPISSVLVEYSDAGGNPAYSGDIWSRTSIGSVTMDGKILPVNPPAATLKGGAGFDSGAIFCGNPDTGAAAGKLGGVRILKGVAANLGSGSIFGGGGMDSGTIYGDAGIGSVYIGGDLQGGNVTASGAVISGTGAGGAGVGKIGPVTVRGNMIGGAGQLSGSIQSSAGLTSVLVYGNEKGGAGLHSGSILAGTGTVLGGNVTSITIRGELDSAAGAARDQTGIFVDGVLTTVTVGKINPNATPQNPTQWGAIAARGLENKNGNVMPGTAIGSVVIGSIVNNVGNGTLNFFDIAAGFDDKFDSNNTNPAALNNPDATIGSVTVNGTVFASSITAGTSWGADNTPGPDRPIGANPTTDDAPLPFAMAPTGTVAIGKIIVTGSITAGAVNSNNNTVFETSQLGTVTVGGVPAPGFPGVALKEILLFNHAYLLQVKG